MNLDPHSKRLLQSLEDFVQRMHALNKADNPKLVYQLAVKWTNAQPLLTKKLLEYIFDFKSKITAGQEAAIVEQIVRNRLIKEFKQDNLTLPIRKVLYAKNLIKLLTKTEGQLAQTEYTYLGNLQSELGLSQHECEAIQEQYLQSVVGTKNLWSATDLVEVSGTNNKLAKVTSYQELISLIENSPIYEELQESDSVAKVDNQSHNSWLGNNKLWWLFLPIPIFLFILIFQNYLDNSNTSNITTTDSVRKNDCGDLTNIQSSRLSLGEKLLTQQFDYLNSTAKIALYEATEAFSRCEYSLAQAKFAEALNIEQNNPEARIYFNNALAIAQDNFKIAVSVPLVSEPEIAREILRGVAQAQTQINQQGGIRNKPLLVQIANDDNNPQIASQLANQLTADQNILAVVGHNDSNTSIAASSIYQKQQLLMISPTSSSTKLPAIGSYIMRTAPSVAALANSLSNYSAVNSFNRIAICTDSTSSSSSSFTQEFIADIQNNGAEVASVQCDFAQANFNPVRVINQAIAQNADALLLAGSIRKINESVSVALANQNRLPLLGNHSLYTYETIETGQEAVAGMVLAVPWLPETSNFVKNARKLWGGQVNWRTAMSYDATQAIIQGLEQADDRSELYSVLNSPDFLVDGATETFKFRQGDRLSEVQLAYIGKPKLDSSSYQFLHLDINQKINSF